MIISKRVMLRLCIVAELLIAFLFFMFGSQGMLALRGTLQEHAVLALQVEQEQQEVQKLHEQIREWKAHDFFKEKMAREQLQMARPNEQVYVLN